MTPEAYDAKRRARYERLLAAAERAQAESAKQRQQAYTLASVIPFGQPILVGHHSEAADRAYRARVAAKQRKGYALHQKAEALRERAAACAQNHAIFSDDPNASEKIADKIVRLEARQHLMREANKLVRKGDKAGLAALGFTPERIEGLFTPDFCGRLGFPDYELTNSSAEIRRLKKRAAALQVAAARPSTEVQLGAVKISDNADANRVQIQFPDKPSEACRAMLKAHGFKWAPSAGVWQRHRNADARYWAEAIVRQHYPVVPALAVDVAGP